MLRDGSPVLIRQIQAADAPLLADIFARLSPVSRWMRFLAAKNHLTEAELRYLTDIDHHDHEALAAVDHPGGHGLGVARYIRDPRDPRAAEIAVTVVDEWHRRGLGTELMSHLSDRARRAGIGRFTALMSADNVAMAGLLRTMSGELVHHEADTVEYQVILAPSAEASHDWRARNSDEERERRDAQDLDGYAHGRPPRHRAPTPWRRRHWGGADASRGAAARRGAAQAGRCHRASQW